MKYGYARVSSIKQGFGTSLDEQEKMLREAGAEKIYRDEWTGTTTERPQFQKLLAKLQAGDTLIACKMDRFARNTQDAINLVSELREREIAVHILNMGIIDNTPIGKLIMTIMAAFAEYERDMIYERTQGGRVIARRNPDYREGRKPKYSREQLNHALSLLENHSYRQVVEMTGISKATLIRAKQKKAAEKK